MADISLKLRADELGKSLEDLAVEVEMELEAAVQNLAQAAYASIMAKAEAELSSTRQDYTSNLDFTPLGDGSYLISLIGSAANSLEDGYSGFDMVPGMLNSNKTVQTGSRSGEKWVKTNQEGKKYAHVPFEHKPYSKEPKSSDLNAEIKRLTSTNRSGAEQKLTKMFADIDGSPLSGKVATARSDNKLLDQITKYQHVSDTGKVSSLYMTFRTVSEDSAGWKHPGWKGLKAFEEAERWVEKELDLIIETLL